MITPLLAWGPREVNVVAIEQLVTASANDARALLPSFLYAPIEAEAATLHWIVGEWARALGAQTPVRLVGSAKSWLSHPTLDRRAASLPAGSPDEVPKVSPLDASARYLAHLRALG